MKPNLFDAYMLSFSIVAAILIHFYREGRKKGGVKGKFETFMAIFVIADESWVPSFGVGNIVINLCVIHCYKSGPVRLK